MSSGLQRIAFIVNRHSCLLIFNNIAQALMSQLSFVEYPGTAQAVSSGTTEPGTRNVPR